MGAVMVYGQEFPTIIPPSPNAGSLGQYVDVPVSNYTGVPNISIPLYNIKSGKIDLPITLSYHASGIKVAQEASLVGLGWALNAGGVITRQVRGLDDFLPDGYLNTTLPPATENNLPDWSDTNLLYDYVDDYNNIKSGVKDGEPDLFYYNFLGYSGKVVFEKQSGTELRATSLDQNNLDITYNKTSKIWTVIDGNGWVFSLGSVGLHAVETTINYSMSDDNPFINPPLIIGGTSVTSPVDTAWYLTKIITPEGESIEFIYENLGGSLSQISFSELIYEHLETRLVSHQGYGYLSPFNNPTKKFFISQQRVTGSYLKKIEFSNGVIEFNHEDREDLRSLYGNSFKPKRLKSTELYDLHGKLIKKINFDHSYFNYDISDLNGVNPENYLRLRLDAVQESFYEGNNYRKKPPYLFSYNATKLPKKTSYSVDYWGYYNGSNNENIRKVSFSDMVSYNIEEGSPTSTYKTLIPFFEYKNENRNDIYLTGANREVDKDKIKAAVLESIQYPMGGVTEFIYEPNDYYDELHPLYEYEQNEVWVQKYGPNTPIELQEKTFTLDQDTVVYFYFDLYQNNDSSSACEDVYYDSSNFACESGGKIARSSFAENSFIIERENGEGVVSLELYMPFTGESVKGYKRVLLTSGTYKLKTVNSIKPGIDMFLSVNFKNHVPTVKKYGAGLRIKTINTKEDEQILKQKNYTYEKNGISTGRIMSPINFFYNETLIEQNLRIIGANVIEYIYEKDYLVTSSNNAIPFGTSAQGNIIGYDEVIVSNTDIYISNTYTNYGDLGNSRFYYKNEEEVPIELFMPGVPNLINTSNGQLLKEEHYNQDGDIVRERSINYVMDESTQLSLKGVKLYVYFADNTYNGNGSPQIRFYDVFSEWWYPVSETETIYDFDGEDSVTTSICYEYENASHKNLTKITQINSKNEEIITTKSYSPDLAGESIIDALIQSNRINTPIVTKNFKIDENGTNKLSELQKTYVEFPIEDAQNNTTMVPLLKEIYQKKGAGAIDFSKDKKLVYHDYDARGNPLEVSKADGTHISYIWGYQQQQPIAKLENASLEQVASAFASLGSEHPQSIAALQSLSDSDDDTCISGCTEAALREALNALRAALPSSQVTTYTYDPLVGLTSITDPRGETIYYQYDAFQRLELVKDAAGNVLRKNEYNYKN